MAIPSQLMQQFLRVEKRYSINPNEEPFFDLAPNLVLERLEYIAPTQQEIEDMARAKLIVAFNKKQDHIEEQYAKTVGEIQVKKQSAQNKALLDKQNVKNHLQQKLDEINYDMLRRGLANSSIKDELLQKAQDDATSQNTSADWVLELTLKELDLAEQKATEQKQLELENLQQNFDIELAQEIADMTEQVAKKTESTAKYNNTQTEKEADYKRNWHSAYIDAKQDHSQSARTLLTVAINEGYEVVAEYIKQDKTTFAKDYYLGFDATTAHNEITSLSQDYIAHLGETHYNELLSFFEERI
ncbi:MAG: hypothetical protein IJ999_06310 [Clostridia bacterium]|nr:hypothetical protein [Clostridia bacterium]